jgi:hypothetical protein
VRVQQLHSNILAQDNAFLCDCRIILVASRDATNKRNASYATLVGRREDVRKIGYRFDDRRARVDRLGEPPQGVRIRTYDRYIYFMVTIIS